MDLEVRTNNKVYINEKVWMNKKVRKKREAPTYPFSVVEKYLR